MLDTLFQRRQYSLDTPEKAELLLPLLNELTDHHRRKCPEYDRMLSVIRPGYRSAGSLAEVPWLPIRMFKTHRLKSIPDSEVFKTLNSSGTTGQQVSTVILDRATAKLQSTALARIMIEILGSARLPMIVVEPECFMTDRSRFSARAAGVLGMMTFGRDHFFCLHDDMSLNQAGLMEFLERHGSGELLIFGFTFMVWQHFFLPCAAAGVDLSRGILVHSGGWKKLEAQAISNAEFRERVARRTGLSKIYNFYGTVEQIGSVFVEGTDGNLYPPNFADVIIRDPVTWEEAPAGVPGVIQLLSALPFSYPGHSILTEDLGVLRSSGGRNDGRLGKRFSVIGRVPKAEMRGCSDTYAPAS